MNILFLDFDGVLNSEDWFRNRKLLPKSVSLMAYSLNQLDPRAVNRLNFIVTKTDCRIVVSSTYRKGYNLDHLITMLETKGLDYADFRVIDVTPNLERLGIDKQIAQTVPRGYEIAAWLSEHEVDKFVILDDDADMGVLCKHLVQTNGRIGLDDAKMTEVIGKFSI